MRIAHYFDRLTLEAGGPARAVLDLTAALAAAGHDVTLLTTDAADVPPSWVSRASEPTSNNPAPAHPTCITLPPFRPPLQLFNRAALDQAARALQTADVLHLHGMWTPTNLQLARLARRLNIPYVVSLRGMLDDWCMAQRAPKKRAFLALGGRRMLESAAFVHCTAQAEQDQSHKHFPRGRPIIIPNLLDLAPYQNLPGPDLARQRFPALATGLPNLLFLSRINYKKRTETLIEAAALLHRRGSPANVFIAGKAAPHDAPYEQSLRDTAARLGLTESVHFLGMVTGELKTSLYEAADLFVLPTSQENFGFVYFEALACATPVLTTRGTDTWPELESSGGAHIVSADCAPEELADAAARLLADPTNLRKMGEAGRSWVLTHLAPNRVLEQFEQMYSRATTG